MFESRWKLRGKHLDSSVAHFHKENKEALMTNRTPEADESFGKGFNLILAVKEQGPARIKEICSRVMELDTERTELMKEHDILQALVNVVDKK